MWIILASNPLFTIVFNKLVDTYGHNSHDQKLYPIRNQKDNLRIFISCSHHLSGQANAHGLMRNLYFDFRIEEVLGWALGCPGGQASAPLGWRNTDEQKNYYKSAYPLILHWQTILVPVQGTSCKYSWVKKKSSGPTPIPITSTRVLTIRSVKSRAIPYSFFLPFPLCRIKDTKQY